MSTVQFLTLLILLIAGFGVLILLVLRQRGAGTNGLLEKITEANTRLENSFGNANANMSGQVERLKGELRNDLVQQVHQGLSKVQETVDRQLAQGRTEQSERLGQTVAALEKKFDDLRTTTDARLEKYGEKQSAALGESTKTLQKQFETLEQKTSQNLETIRGKVDEKLQLISEQVQTKLEKNIQEGFAHFQKVQEHLKAAEEQLRNVGTVGQSINELNNLLKLPHLRGKFGEAELSRLLADFLPAASFAEQVPIAPGSRELVDAVVKFPKFILPIDSKFNREQILPLFEVSDPEQLAYAREQLAVAIKQQARDIAVKYIRPEHGTTELALMFLPSETIYFEVLRNGELMGSVHKLNVFPVSPNTLVITLRAIAMSIDQYEFAKGVEKTLEQIRAAQNNFGHFQRRFEEVGKGLEKAQEAYQTATNHLNRYANKVVRLTGETVAEMPEPVLPENSTPLLSPSLIAEQPTS